MDNHDFTEAYLEILIDDMDETIPYSEFLCPLCKKFPENIEHLMGKDNAEPQLIRNILLSHVANHLESLSLKALPSLQHPDLDGQNIPRQPSGEEAICRALSPDEIEGDFIFTHDKKSLLAENGQTIPQLEQCQYCKKNGPRAAIPLHTAMRFLVSYNTRFGKEIGYFKTCPCCGQNRDFWPNPDNWPLDINTSIALDRRTPYDQEFPDHYHLQVGANDIDTNWIHLWMSWYERCRWSRRGNPMDPILMRLTYSVDLGSPSHVSDPKAWGLYFRLDAGPKKLAAVARIGNAQAARELIENGHNVDMVDQHGMSPLLWAAVQGHEEMVRLLLENKAEIEKCDKTFHRTPLSLAALGGHKAVVDLLLRDGANVDSPDSSRLTPLFWAVIGGHESVIKSLLAFGARYQDPGPDFFMPYSRDEESGDGKYSSRTRFRYTALIDPCKLKCFSSAIEKGDKRAIYQYLEPLPFPELERIDIHGFNIGSKKTILDFAIESGNWEITLILLQYDGEMVRPGSVTMARQLFQVYKGGDGASSVVD
ncbi:unnamed protein product [Clonostachys solani]|uniref:Ankyrin repeat protein n=1 Tax=Clonostachys solani TaxID=160281 RepID=A0A9P0E9B9_9HYPO|nr:unnamed protein product [Clonostachys solani]